MLERDEGLILNTWTDSFELSHRAGVLPRAQVHSLHRRHFERVIRDRAKVLVAVNPQESDPEYEIFGYLVYEEYDDPIVHWAYTKYDYRKMHVMSVLLYEAGIDPWERDAIVTCWTANTAQLLNKYRGQGRPLRIRHDPRFLRSDEWKEKFREISKRRVRYRRRGSPGRAGHPSSPLSGGPEVVHRRSSGR